MAGAVCAFDRNAFAATTYDVCDPEPQPTPGQPGGSAGGGGGGWGIHNRGEYLPFQQPPAKPQFIEAAARVGAILTPKATPAARMGLEMVDDVDPATIAAALSAASIEDSKGEDDD
jgi:hypothetical protein